MADNTMSAVPLNRGRLPRPLEQVVRSAMLKLQVHGAVQHGRSLRLGIGSRISSFNGLSVGDYVSVGRGTHIEVDGSIGNYCLIARGVQIVGRADHALNEVGVPMALSTWVGERAPGALDRVEIGDDVWIGGGAIILGGVSIGSGAVVGAGAVVTKDIAPFGIAVGNPARVVRQRFDSDEQRAMHLDLLSHRGKSSGHAARSV